MSVEHTPTQQKETVDLQPPQKYAVVLKNDDFTPMDFVVDLLMSVFGMTAQKSFEVMLQVHEKGSGIAGVFTREVAEMKSEMALKRARQEGHPFLCVLEKV